MHAVERKQVDSRPTYNCNRSRHEQDKGNLTCYGKSAHKFTYMSIYFKCHHCWIPAARRRLGDRRTIQVRPLGQVSIVFVSGGFPPPPPLNVLCTRRSASKSMWCGFSCRQLENYNFILPLVRLACILRLLFSVSNELSCSKPANLKKKVLF